MIRRPGDKAPEPPGGRAVERLRMFEQARTPAAARGAKSKPAGKRKALPRKKGRSHAQQTRRKD
jgi:hypothetical protein